MESLKQLYDTDEDFGVIWLSCVQNGGAHNDFHIHEGFLFKGNQLCVPRSSLREHLIRELHAGGLAAHPGRDRTTSLLTDRFFWPLMRKEIANFVQRCPI